MDNLEDLLDSNRYLNEEKILFLYNDKIGEKILKSFFDNNKKSFSSFDEEIKYLQNNLSLFEAHLYSEVERCLSKYLPGLLLSYDHSFDERLKIGRADFPNRDLSCIVEFILMCHKI